MAVLTTKKRKRLRDSTFAVVKTIKGKKIRKYPITDISHARNALARVAAFGTPAEKAAVKRKVYTKFPSLKKKKGK